MDYAELKSTLPHIFRRIPSAAIIWYGQPKKIQGKFDVQNNKPYRFFLTTEPTLEFPDDEAPPFDWDEAPPFAWDEARRAFAHLSQQHANPAELGKV